MAPGTSGRVHSDLLLVGSLPAESTEAALRGAGRWFGDLVATLPDGETGDRAGWVTFEREHLARPHPDIETVQDTHSPSGLPRHPHETPVFRVRPGVTQLRWDSWPRIDAAIESYQTFRKLREEGAIPSHVRFQLGLPFPVSALNAFKFDFASDFPIVGAAYEDLVARELRRLTAAIPPEDLAVQWDMAYEVQDLERVIPWTTGDAWSRFAGPVRRLAPLVPEPALVGYHFCYGTFPEWPMFEARDMDLVVRMANEAIQHSGRTVDWVHLAGPRNLRSQERAFFRPLTDLEPHGARVFLGLAQQLDGDVGLRMRRDTAAGYLGEFGLSNYCGFGRQPGEDGEETMREHSRSVRAVSVR